MRVVGVDGHITRPPHNLDVAGKATSSHHNGYSISLLTMYRVRDEFRSSVKLIIRNLRRGIGANSRAVATSEHAVPHCCMRIPGWGAVAQR